MSKLVLEISYKNTFLICMPNDCFQFSKLLITVNPNVSPTSNCNIKQTLNLFSKKIVTVPQIEINLNDFSNEPYKLLI